MGIKRVVDTEFWTDNKVVDLFSPEDRYFFLYLMTNPHTTQLGIYPINKRIMAFELGYSLEAVTVLIDRFQNKYGIIKYSDYTSEIAIKNYLRHSIVKGGKPVEDLLTKEISKVKDRSLLEYIYRGIRDDITLNATVKNILPLLINDNDNDNDNEDSWYESYNESHNDSSKHRFTPPTLEEVISYCQEKGYQVNAERFINFYESKGWMVGKNKMKNWKAAVANWATSDKPKKADWEKELEEWVNGEK